MTSRAKDVAGTWVGGTCAAYWLLAFVTGVADLTGDGWSAARVVVGVAWGVSALAWAALWVAARARDT